MIADMVRDGEAIMLDASSTAAYVARELKGKKEGLTIITNSVEIILELFDVPEWNVISTGGVSREKSFALVGPNTNRMIALTTYAAVELASSIIASPSRTISAIIDAILCFSTII